MLIEEKVGSGQIFWKSIDKNGKIWFQHQFQLPFALIDQEKPAIKLLKQLFQEALLQNPDCLSFDKEYQVTTQLEFPRLWGLGSSSTMIYNLSQWLNVDPYRLLNKTMGGSGYDLACAGNDKPLIYQLVDNKPIVESINFYPQFTDQLYFVYLNQKQKSQKEVRRYKKQKKDIQKVIPIINEITDLIIKSQNISDFNLLLHEHEKVMSSVLNRPVIQEQFSDFDGQLKSLGAWGGDFILASGGSDTVNYFNTKGFKTVISYKEMIK